MPGTPLPQFVEPMQASPVKESFDSPDWIFETKMDGYRAIAVFDYQPPVKNPPRIPERIRWVQPKLVCEVAFAEWTEDEQLRQTTFLGWRDDKTPEEVVIETAGSSS
jgi:ATP-dependent DNA ligase